MDNLIREMKKVFTNSVICRSSKNQKMTIEVLNDDCLLLIFQYLTIADRINIEKVSKRWKLLSQISWSGLKALDFNPTTWGQKLEKINRMKGGRLEKVLNLSGKYITTVNFELLNEKDSSKYLKTQALIAILKRSPNIRELIISNTEPLDRPEWKIILELLMSISHNIRKFGIRIHSTDYIEEDLAKLFAEMINLKHVTFERISEGFQGSCLLSLPSDIEEINFEKISSEFQNVESLNLMIERSEKLRTLVFDKARILDFDFLLNSVTLRAKNLTKLIIRHSKWTPHNPALLLSTMSELVNLETLDVKWSSFVNDDLLGVVASTCKKLQNLSIEHCQNITDIGITSISKLKRLNILMMSHLSNLVSPELKNLQNVQILDCSFASSLPEESIISLLQTDNQLEFLNISGSCNLSKKLAKEVSKTMKRKRSEKTFFLLIQGENKYPELFKSDSIKRNVRTVNPFSIKNIPLRL